MNAWLIELPNIEQLHIPRSFEPSSKEEIRSTQLHNFSDASQSGYGAVSYLRFKDSNDDIHCSFVMAKSRVAPLKAPAILRFELAAAVVPKHSPISCLIARYYHRLAGHSGLEHVVSMIRQRFWNVGARNVLKKMLNSCVDCKRRQAPAGEQKMADLPRHRVTPDKPPFTLIVGVDCFGPFLVKRARSLEKCYGVMFTCLAIRAVHIEVIRSLDTNSFLHALCRFIARRGSQKIQQIRPNNGGNFC